MPQLDLIGADLATVRAVAHQALTAVPAPEGALMPEERFVPAADEGAPVRVLVWRSPAAHGPLPAILHLHGGGYVLGNPDMGAEEHRAMVAANDCVVVAVQYALAPEARHPAAVESSYAALRWMFENAAELGLDPARIGVAGQSAGGGLAAALALLARDRGEYRLAFQHLTFPMLDDRTCTAADPHPHAGHLVWTHEHNHFGWQALLGAEPGGPDVSPYAAAARAADLAGLPPTFISVGALDLFLEEDLEYARRLTRAGVAVELHVYPGAYHGFTMVRDAAITRQATRDSDEALARFLRG